jgi:hypothetical protein
MRMRTVVFWIAVVFLAATCTPAETQRNRKKTAPRTQSAYDRAVAEARRAGLAVLPSDIKTGPVPAAQNSAPFYRQIDAYLRKQPTGEADSDVMRLLGRTPPTAAEVARGREIIEQRTAYLKLIHEAASRPKCDFQRDWSLGPNMLFPEYARMRSAARWLLGESGLLLQDGKPAEAAHNLAQGFRIAQHAASDPILIGHLVAVAIDAITLQGMENILLAAGDQPVVPQAVRTALERNWKKPSLAFGLTGETVMQYVAVKMVRQGGLKTLRELTAGEDGPPPLEDTPFNDPKYLDTIVDDNGRNLLRIMRKLIAAADQPYPTASRAVPAELEVVEQSKDPRYMLALVLLPVLDQAVAVRARDEAKASAVRAGASLLEYKAKHGSFPATLAEAISSVPADPFDLKPLRYRREGGGFVVWSVSQSLTFDGGDPATKPAPTEIAFRYPLPAYLRNAQPAK